MIAVLGNGPLGSSVARALAVHHGHCVELFASPTLWSSHDDKGRLSRVVDFEGAREWIGWNKASLAAWRGLERASGIQFYRECGSVIFVPKAQLDGLAPQMDGVEYKKVRREEVLGGQLGEAVPELGLLETAAGYVNPKDLIAAQNAVFEAHGGKLWPETVEAIVPLQDGVEVSTAICTRRYDRVVICAGAYTNTLLAMLPAPLGEPLPYRTSRRTVLLGQVSKEDVVDGVLKTMPVMKITCEVAPSGDEPRGASGASGSDRDKAEAGSAYILPPIWYVEFGPTGPYILLTRQFTDPNDPPGHWYIRNDEYGGYFIKAITT